MTAHELLDFLLIKGCQVIGRIGSQVRVACKGCRVIFSLDEAEMSTRTLNDIERELEPCLGPRWLPL